MAKTQEQLEALIAFDSEMRRQLTLFADWLKASEGSFGTRFFDIEEAFSYWRNYVRNPVFKERRFAACTLDNLPLFVEEKCK